jgi:hypothetical protein
MKDLTDLKPPQTAARHNDPSTLLELTARLLLVLELAEVLLSSVWIAMSKLNEEQEDGSQSNWLVDGCCWEEIQGSRVVEDGEAAANAIDDGVEENADDLPLFSWADVAGEMGYGQEEADGDVHGCHATCDVEEELLEVQVSHNGLFRIGEVDIVLCSCWHEQ